MVESFYNISSCAIEEISSRTSRLGGSKFVSFGSSNRYPQELFGLFKSVPSLRTLIEGSALISSSLFSCPEGIDIDFNSLFTYLYTYAQVPILIRQSNDGKKFFLTPIDPRFVRTTDDLSSFAYSETDSFKKRIEYPAYPTDSGSSIIYIKLNDLEHPYALPIWSSALREVQMLSNIALYHHSSLTNGFTGSYLINFNSGTPSSEDKEEIERLVQAKFGGASNAGRILLSFNNSKEEEASVQSLNTEDTSSRYMDLVRSCKEALYSSFRASSQLFGSPDGSETALTENEYAWKLSLFVKFTVVPIIETVYNKLKQFGITYSDPMSIVEQVKQKSE